MFTKDQIIAAFDKLQSGVDLPRFISDLMALGVVHFDTQAADGATVYVGADGTAVAMAIIYPSVPKATTPNSMTAPRRILPFSKKCMLKAEVLNAKRLLKYSNADW